MNFYRNLFILVLSFFIKKNGEGGDSSRSGET